MKFTRRLCAVTLALSMALSMTACGASGQSGNTNNNTTTANSTSGSAAAAQTAALLAVSVEAPDLTEATVILCSGESVQVTGEGAAAEAPTVTITSGGVYLVKGTLNDGRIVINAPGEDVTIALENADITCTASSPLYIYKASSVLLWVEKDSASSLTDGGSYTYDDSWSSEADEEPNACLYSKADLVIAGGGALTVNGNCNNGVTSKDTLLIDGVALTVNAVNHGINGKDSCTVQGASITVTSGGDGLRATNDSDATLGWVALSGSTVTLTTGEDGIQAETALTVTSGTITVTSGGGAGTTLSDDASAKGLKAGVSMTLSGGTFVMNCADDAFHTNGDMTVSGGSYTVATGDDGFHADGALAVSGGTVAITECYEGLEGTTVDISGGEISIVASDDGINAAGGDGGETMFGQGDSTYWIHVSGGVTTVDAGGDGIDSNGDIVVSGGELYISGSTGDGDSAIDCDGNASITGGIVFAAGSTGMAQNFGTSSTQGSMLVTFSGGSTEQVTLTDESGTVLASFTPAKRYTCVVISTPDVVEGGTYTVTAGTQSQSVTMGSLIYGSGMGMGGQGGMGGQMQPGGQGGMGGQMQPGGQGGSTDTTFDPAQQNGQSGGTPPTKPN